MGSSVLQFMQLTTLRGRYDTIMIDCIMKKIKKIHKISFS